MSKVAWMSVGGAITFERAALLFTIMSVSLLYALVFFEPGSIHSVPAKHQIYAKLAQVPFGSQKNWQPTIRLGDHPFAQSIAVTSNTPTRRIKNVFDQIGYKSENVRWYHEVPRIFLTTLPKDLPNLREPEKRKNVFIMMMLPLVLHTNELILQTRTKLRTLLLSKESGKTLSVKDQRFLSSIAIKYGSTITAICEVNKLNRNKPMRIGKTIKVPVGSYKSPPKKVYYTVKRGDTLSEIAVKYRTSVSKIKRWNGLRSNLIYPGKKLVIHR